MQVLVEFFQVRHLDQLQDQFYVVLRNVSFPLCVQIGIFRLTELLTERIVFAVFSLLRKQIVCLERPS